MDKMREFGSSALLAWVACLLTLGASGDDVNFLRLSLATPSCPQPNGPLPLDDPNTDFTPSVKLLRKSELRDEHATRQPAWCAVAVDRYFAAPIHHLLRAGRIDGRLGERSHAPLLIPLLC
jgi:hypothetical protein